MVNDGAARRTASSERNLVGGDERNVARHLQHAAAAFRRQGAGGSRDRRGVAAARRRRSGCARRSVAPAPARRDRAVTTAMPASPRAPATAASTSSSIASARPGRRWRGTASARRSLAPAVSLTGMTAQISASPFNCDLRSWFTLAFRGPRRDAIGKSEHGARQGLAIVETLHQGAGGLNRQIRHRSHLGIGIVHHIAVDEAAVMCRDRQRIDRRARARSSFSRSAL